MVARARYTVGRTGGHGVCPASLAGSDRASHLAGISGGSCRSRVARSVKDGLLMAARTSSRRLLPGSLLFAMAASSCVAAVPGGTPQTDRSMPRDVVVVEHVALAQEDPRQKWEDLEDAGDDGESGESEVVATAAAEELFVPRGAFATIEALCRAQEALAEGRIAKAREEAIERGEDSKVRASCRRSTTALAKAKVAIRAPYLDVAAIEVETGWAKATHVVARTSAGWRAIPGASVTDFHDDPGCFSITRDIGIAAVRVEGSAHPALVVVESSGRGIDMEEPTDATPWIGWEQVTERAVACRVRIVDGARELACDAGVVTKVAKVPSTTAGGRRVTVAFETGYTVDDRGHLHAKKTPPAETLDDEP